MTQEKNPPREECDNAQQLTKVLQGATEDLKNAELPGIVGKVFNPIREEFLVPLATRVTEEVIPEVPLWQPLDKIGSMAVTVPIATTKFAYSLLPHGKDVDEETHDFLSQNLDQLGKDTLGREPQSIFSLILGAAGFIVNTAIDIATLPVNGKLLQWIGALTKFVGYISISGLWKDLLTAFISPRTLENLLIVARTQEAKNDTEGETRRDRTAFHGLPLKVEETEFKKIFNDILKDASRYIRYSSSAYGVLMIDSANTLQIFGKELDVSKATETLRRRKIANYVGVPEEDIVLLSKPGGNMDVVGHFIALDHRKNYVTGKKGTVVLSIRGTYTISGLLIDANAYSKEYCDGFAHSAIATSTDNLWDAVKEDIIKLLKDNPGYNLVINGHSLGAGIAALLSLKLQYRNLLKKADSSLANVQVHCFAFACPPVYYQAEESKEIKDAMKNIYGFIHENDCVPFLSVDAIRRLSQTVIDIDKIPSHFPFQKLLMAAGVSKISDEVKKDVFKKRDLPFLEGAQPLAVPTAFLMWMEKFDNDKRGRPMFNTMFCHPEGDNNIDGTNDLNILLDVDMITDHMPPGYEQAIYSIREQIKYGKDGFILKDERVGGDEVTAMA